MGGLCQSDIRAVLALAHDWAGARSTAELEPFAIGGLERLVRCEAIGWNQIDVAGRTVRTITDPPDYVSARQMARLGELIQQHPIVTYYAGTGDGTPVAISDFLSLRQFERLELYADIYRPLGVTDQLGLAVRTGPLLTGVAFNRSRRSFSERDREVLELVRPHLALAYANAHGREVATVRIGTLERGLDEPGRAVALLRRDALDPLSREGEHIVRRWFPGGVPPVLNGRPIVLEDDGVRLTVRRVEGDPPVLLLDEERSAPDPVRVRELGLTARESEILALAAQGLSDARIAEELVVSVRTVEKHLEHAYRKLGVGGRREALAKLGI